MKAAAKNKEKNPNFYADIGRTGGKNGKGEGYTGGFAGDHELASRAGKIGGAKSKRKASKYNFPHAYF